VQRRRRQHCPFTPGVGVSGVYFSFDSGHDLDAADLHRPDRARLPRRARARPAVHGAHRPIGTLPWYYENGLVSDGDPAVAFGRGPGERVQLEQRLAALLREPDRERRRPRSEQAFKGFEAIAVSRTDNVAAAARRRQSAWMPPVIDLQAVATTFSDKEQIWADNASSSPFFGNVYVCWASFRGGPLA
jgi:hypothetical protein